MSIDKLVISRAGISPFPAANAAAARSSSLSESLFLLQSLFPRVGPLEELGDAVKKKKKKKKTTWMLCDF